MVVRPTKDSVNLVKQFLEKHGLTLAKNLGYLTILPDNTVIHVKGVQPASTTTSNAYYPKNYEDIKSGRVHFLVFYYKDIDNAFILPFDKVNEIFGGLPLAKKGKARWVYHFKVEADGRHYVKCDSRGGKWVDIEDFRSKWGQIPAMGGKAGSVSLPGSAKDLDSLAIDTLFDKSLLSDINKILRTKQQVIFAGPPGTSKTFVAESLAEFFTGDPNRVKKIQFHPSWSYEDFVEGIRPVLDEEDTKSKGASKGASPQFKISMGILQDLADDCRKDSNDHVLIIDEINRGDIPRIFGELINMLDYRGKSIALTYSPKKRFSIPPNLFIIATMNSQDRSIAFLDYAIQRRFPRIYFSPKKEVLSNWFARHPPVNLEVGNILDGFDKVNSIIKDSPLGEDFLIGHSYLMKEKLDSDMLRLIIEYELRPLIIQYFSGKRENDTIRKIEDAFRLMQKIPEVTLASTTNIGTPVIPTVTPSEPAVNTQR